MSAKRHKAGGTCSASCKEGLLNDHTDTMELMAKQMALALDESTCRSILHSCKAIAKRISLGGLCTGSGTGSQGGGAFVDVIEKKRKATRGLMLMPV